MENESKNMLFAIFVTQAVAVAVILLALTVIKFFCSDTFSKIEKWHGDNILDKTVITQVFDGEENNEI